MRIFYLVSLVLVAFFVNAGAQEKLPEVAREFRGMWVATVMNLDFPSKQDLTVAQQKAELVKLVDLAEELRMNAIIFQVRSMGDAVYVSDIEPSSPFLTGTTGKKLDFDPLQFLIEEAHGRGIVVHAWFNPYRALSPSYKGELPENHVVKKHPEWIRDYSNYKMIDPSNPDARDYVVSVITDVTKRYDIDGVHFDDYFYPYPVQDKEFPDSEAYDAYKNSGGKLSKDDWRRKNIDDFILQTSEAIKKTKPDVMFGVSPFGVWKENEQLGIRCGTCSYNVLYADAKKWFNEGWVDYLSPQLYWSTTKTGQQFPTLLKWWNGENKKKRHLWAGIAPYRIGEEKSPDYNSKEIETQILMTRGLLKEGAGTIHFRAGSLAANKDGLKDNLRDKVYKGNAIIPASPWIKSKALASPVADAKRQGNGEVLVTWSGNADPKILRWILYWNDGSGWKPTVIARNITQANMPGTLNVKRIGLVAVDRLGNFSDVTFKDVAGK